MAVIEFKNEEEYNNVNTQIQSMLDNGLNNIPSTYEAFGLNSNSFFKLDLNNDNPFELDDKFTTRARGDKGDSYSNAFKYGFKGSVASTFELLASIPGGYDRFRDWMVEFVGLEPNPDNIADHIQDYFNAIAKKFDPMQLGMDPPSSEILFNDFPSAQGEIRPPAANTIAAAIRSSNGAFHPGIKNPNTPKDAIRGII